MLERLRRMKDVVSTFSLLWHMWTLNYVKVLLIAILYAVIF